MVRARMARNRPPVVVGKAHFDGRDSETVQPAANVLLLFPARVPLREHDHRRPVYSRREKLAVDAIVFLPWRGNRAGKDSTFSLSGSRRPVVAAYQSSLRARVALDEAVEKCAGVGIVRITADVLQTPGKRQNAAVGLLGPPRCSYRRILCSSQAFITEPSTIAEPRNQSKLRPIRR